MKAWFLVYWLIKLGPNGEFVMEEAHSFYMRSEAECQEVLARTEAVHDEFYKQCIWREADWDQREDQ